jgi:hypothetical protein
MEVIAHGTVPVQPMSHPEHHNKITVPTPTRHNSTTMDPIQEAIEAIELREAGESFLYRKVAKRFGVDRSTLSRGHQHKTRSNAEEARQRQLLNPQQELELVRYIEKCTRRRLPPTREMVANFTSAIVK